MRYSHIVFFCVVATLTLPSLAAGHRAAKLLTRGLAETIVGQPVKDVVSNSAVDAESGGSWTSRVHYDAANGDDVGCGLLLQHFESQDGAARAFEAYGKKFNAMPLDSFGCRAYKIAGPPEVLGAVKGKDYLIVSAGSKKSANSEMQQRLIKALLAEMQK